MKNDSDISQIIKTTHLKDLLSQAKIEAVAQNSKILK
jgi:hypothetical protein